MSQINRILYVKDPLYISPIDYVQSSNHVPIVFKLSDYPLSVQMTASVLVIRPDKTFEFDSATIDVSENTITVQPTSTMFAIPGGHYLQVRVYNTSEEIQIAFDVLVRVAQDHGSLATMGVNIIPFVDRAALSAQTAGEYEESARESAESAAASAEAAAASEATAETCSETAVESAATAVSAAANAATSETNAASSETNAAASETNAADSAASAAALVRRLEEDVDILEILENASALVERIEELHTLELVATLSLPASGWDSSTRTISGTATGVTTSSNVRAVARLEGTLADYMKIVSAEATATDTVTFTAEALPAGDLRVQIYYI